MRTSDKNRRFEGLVAWQKARKLTGQVYRLTEDGELSTDAGLRDLIRRSAVSIMASIAEGFERGKPDDFPRFLSTAKSSCAELRSHLYVALDAGYLSHDCFERLSDRANEVGRIIGGLRVSSKESRNVPPTHDA